MTMEFGDPSSFNIYSSPPSTDSLKVENLSDEHFQGNDFHDNLENSFNADELMNMMGHSPGMLSQMITSPSVLPQVLTPTPEMFPPIMLPIPYSTPPPKGDFEGKYKFEISLSSEKADRKKFLYSRELNRVYLSMLAEMPIQFRWDYNALSSVQLYIRATLILADSHQQESRVSRCHNHRVPNDISNQDIPEDILGHVLRSARVGADVIYSGSEKDNHWLSVLILTPSEPPEGATDFSNVYKFCCKHSCTSGINRRRIEVIFTLEDTLGHVFGRKSLGVRVCSCPKRDMQKDEEEMIKSDPDGSPLCKKRKMLPKKGTSSAEGAVPHHFNSNFLVNLEINSFENYKSILNHAHGLMAKDYLEMDPKDPSAKDLLLKIDKIKKMVNDLQHPDPK